MQDGVTAALRRAVLWLSDSTRRKRVTGSQHMNRAGAAEGQTRRSTAAHGVTLYPSNNFNQLSCRNRSSSPCAASQLRKQSNAEQLLCSASQRGVGMRHAPSRQSHECNAVASRLAGRPSPRAPR